jgi:predicted dienelactone hydrolase
MRCLCKILALFIALPLAACDFSAYKAGMTTRAFIPAGDYDWRGSSIHALITTVWYPAAGGVEEQDIGLPPGPSPVWNAGQAAVDAPPFNPLALLSNPAIRSDPRFRDFLRSLPGFKHSFPLIVLSHGDGSDGTLLAWMGEAMASKGFVVAAVEHPGDNSMEAVTLDGFALRWKRAADLKAVIDGVLTDPVLGDLIDRNRIGAAGHSLGGYSVIELAGGRTDLQAYGQYCSSSPLEACAPPPDRADFVTYIQEVAQDPTKDPMLAEALGHAGDSYLDKRVGAIFAMAPAFGYSFDTTSLRKISIPVHVVVGDADALAPAQWNAEYYVESINANKRFKNASLDVLQGGVGHFVFLDLPTEFGKQVLPPDLALDLPGVDRAAIHDQVAQSALKFFCESLRVNSPWVKCPWVK